MGIHIIRLTQDEIMRLHENSASLQLSSHISFVTLGYQKFQVERTMKVK